MKKLMLLIVRCGLAAVINNLVFSNLSKATGLVAVWGSSVIYQFAVPTELQVGGVRAVSAAAYHNLALKSDGRVVAWGNLLGAIATNVPAQLSGVKAIAAGHNFNLVLKADGTIVAWGTNDYGQLNVPAGLGGVRAVAAGLNHALALKTDGRVVAWGRNDSAQTNVPADLANVVAIAAGGYHNLALRADGTVVAWGRNASGQTNVPSDLTGVVAVAAGLAHSMALKFDGTVVVWGGITNVPANLSNVVAIAAGYYHCLALKADGTIVVWDSAGPGDVPPGLVNATAISGGHFHNLAIVDAGPVQIVQPPKSQEVPPGATATFMVVAIGHEPISYQWYFNGQPMSNSDRVSGATNAMLTISDTRFIDTGSYSVVVANPLGAALSLPATLTVTGSPVITRHPTSWNVRAGADVSFTASAEGTPPLSFWLLFNETNVVAARNITSPVATASFTLTNVQPAQSGVYAVLVSNAYGSVLSSSAVLTVTNSPPYVLVQPTNQTVPIYSTVTMRVVARGSEPVQYQWHFKGVSIPGATNATLTLTNVGHAHTGHYNVLISNPFGQTNSAKVYLHVTQLFVWPIYYTYLPPTNVPAGLSNVIAVAAGNYHVLALKADGTVATWQNYPFPPLTNVPTSVMNVVAIAAGGNVSMALRADGRVVVWGDSYRQTNVPPTVSNVVAIATGGNHCLAVRSDGTVVCWGDNTYRQATPPPGLSNVIAVAAGRYHSVALKADGTVVAWGSSSAGQTNVPLGLSNVIAISAGAIFSAAVKADGTTIAWGSGSNLVPRGLSDAVALAACDELGLALKANGTVVGGERYFTPPPAGLSNVIAIAAGGMRPYFGVAAVGNGSPGITIHPASQPVSKGSTVQLRVRAAGVQPMFYQWQRDGVNITGATNADLIITNLQGKDTGNYRAIVFNALGVATSRVATLAIQVNTNLAAALNATNLVWGTWSAANPAGTPQIRTTGLWFAQGRETHDDDAAAQSGAIGHNQQSVLQTTVIGPGALSFWWKVSSEAGYDFLRFYWNNMSIPYASLSGETDWQQITLTLGAGAHTLRWAYIKDGSVDTGRDAGWVDEVVFTPEPPVIKQQPTNVVAWVGKTVSFTVSATGSPPLTYQWLKHGTNLSGASSPTLGLVNVTRRDSGTYAVVVCNGGGCVTSSNATLTVIVPQRLSTPAVTPVGSFVFESGDADGGLLLPEHVARFEAQASTNLIDWVSLPGAISFTNGLLLVRDPDATNYSARFYRVIER